MANGYEKFDNRFDNTQSGSGFVMGLLAGAVLGAGLGMLFASKPGSELRNQLSEQANAFANRAKEGYRSATKDAGQWAEKGKEVAGEWAERGKDMYGKARDAATRGAAEAKEYVRDTADAVADATEGRSPSDPDYWTSGAGSRRS